MKRIQKFGKETGFTLLEMTAVIAIFVLMTAFALPQIMGMVQNGKYRDVASDIGMMLREARSRAISTNQEHRVQFEFDNERYRMTRGPVATPVEVVGWKSVPPGVKLWHTTDCFNATATTSLTMEFNPNGTGVNHRICVLGDDHGALVEKIRVGVSSNVTGRVYIEKI